MRGSLKNIRLFVILLLILSVAASSFFVTDSNEECKKSGKELATKKETKRPSEEISKPSEFEAVVPFFAFDLIKDTYLISKLNFQIDLKEVAYVSEPQYTSRYFKTLFCFVISPNAP